MWKLNHSLNRRLHHLLQTAAFFWILVRFHDKIHAFPQNSKSSLFAAPSLLLEADEGFNVNESRVSITLEVIAWLLPPDKLFIIKFIPCLEPVASLSVRFRKSPQVEESKLR